VKKPRPSEGKYKDPALNLSNLVMIRLVEHITVDEPEVRYFFLTRGNCAEVEFAQCRWKAWAEYNGDIRVAPASNLLRYFAPERQHKF
jgi:hypothetical protein